MQVGGIKPQSKPKQQKLIIVADDLPIMNDIANQTILVLYKKMKSLRMLLPNIRLRRRIKS